MWTCRPETAAFVRAGGLEPARRYGSAGRLCLTEPAENGGQVFRARHVGLAVAWPDPNGVACRTVASAYPTELSTVSVGLDLLDVDGDPRMASAVTRTSERLEPLVAPLDYVTIDWDALEAIMRSPEDERKFRLAHQTARGP